MAAVRYYLDEHVAEAIATGLRNRGIDVLTLSEAAMLGASDREHFSYAYTDARRNHERAEPERQEARTHAEEIGRHPE
jgi:hypothetical protein